MSTINEAAECDHPEQDRRWNGTLRSMQCTLCGEVIDSETERVQMNVRVPRPLMIRMRNESQRRMVSVNMLAERALGELLARLEAEQV